LKTSKYVFLILSFLLLSVSTLYAAPDPTSSTGTWAVGNEVTVTGTNFGTKTNAAPLKFDDFEDGVDTARLQSTGFWLEYNLNDGARYSNLDPYLGSLSARNDVVADGGFATNYYSFTPTMLEMSVIYYWKIANADIRVDYLGCKLTRLNSSAAAGGESNGIYNGRGATYYTNYNPYYGGGTYLSYESNDGTSTRVGYLSPSPNVWNRIHTWKKLSTAGVSDGYCGVNVIGRGEIEDNPAVTRDTGYTFTLDTVWLGLVGANQGLYGPGTQCELLIDDIYIDNTLARVELGNAASYDACSKLEVLIPYSWSTTSAGVLIRGDFAADETAYVFVTDSDGATNSTGLEITIGTGSPLPVVNDCTVSGVSQSIVDNDDSISVGGNGFGAAQGSGNVYICDDIDQQGSLTETQTVDTWADGNIDFTCVQGSFDPGASGFVIVENDTGNFSNGFPVSFYEAPVEATFEGNIILGDGTKWKLGAKCKIRKVDEDP